MPIIFALVAVALFTTTQRSTSPAAIVTVWVVSAYEPPAPPAVTVATNVDATPFTYRVATIDPVADCVEYVRIIRLDNTPASGHGKLFALASMVVLKGQALAVVDNAIVLFTKQPIVLVVEIEPMKFATVIFLLTGVPAGSSTI